MTDIDKLIAELRKTHEFKPDAPMGGGFLPGFPREYVESERVLKDRAADALEAQAEEIEHLHRFDWLKENRGEREVLLARIEAQDKAIREALDAYATCRRGGYLPAAAHQMLGILSSVLEQTPEPPEPEWEYGTVIGPLDAGWVTANLTRERALEKAADTRVKRTAVRRRAPGPWEPLTPEGSGR